MIEIRPIEAQDNQALAQVIRQTLTEFGAAKPGTVYFDKSTDVLSTLFDFEQSAYFVAVEDGKILGGGGIFPTDGLPAKTCELVKMYLLTEARGQGVGRTIMDYCFAFAKRAGYQQIYLETMPELAQAIAIYEKLGFSRLQSPLGNSGHFDCDIWMIKKINSDNLYN